MNLYTAVFAAGSRGIAAQKSLGRLLSVTQALVELVEQGLGRVRDDGTRREDRLGAGALELVIVLRRHHTPDDNHDVLAALLDERGFELRNEREMRCRKRGHAEHVNVVFNGLARGLRRRGE